MAQKGVLGVSCTKDECNKKVYMGVEKPMWLIDKHTHIRLFGW